MNKHLSIATSTVIGAVIIELLVGTFFLWCFFTLHIFEPDLTIDYSKILGPLTFMLPFSLLISLSIACDIEKESQANS